MKSLLVVEDERSIREGLVEALELSGYRAIGVDGIQTARQRLRDGSVDALLVDIRLKDGSGLDLLAELQQRDDAPPVIIATAYGDSAHTIEAMRLGAFDYVTKPFDLPALLEVVARAARPVREADVPELPAGRLIGTSEAMLPVWKAIGRAAASTEPVLLLGETGTGKELVAREIHTWSRRKGPFVPVNLAAVPEGLVGSELFGHERGAFTGAEARHIGRVERAAGGTLFLDEIGDLEPAQQTLLLRLLQERTFERLGGRRELTTDARILAATHKPVKPGDSGATLRDDLYYRLAVLEIRIPPLRERRSDIPLLVAHALEGTGARAVTEPAMACLQAHAWPGNVRELLHVVRRAVAMAGREVIDVHDLPPQLADSTPAAELHESLDLQTALRQTEERVIRRALRVADGNRSQAARLLGISRPRLYARMRELGIT